MTKHFLPRVAATRSLMPSVKDLREFFLKSSYWCAQHFRYT